MASDPISDGGVVIDDLAVKELAVSRKTLRRATYGALIGLSVFSGLSAVGGAVGMIIADGLGMPKSLLADSPFATYLIPGLILGVAVGGPQVVASVLLIAKRESALLWSAMAGFGMLIWILIEIGIIHEFGWAQTIYVVAGLLQLILVFAQLGIVSWLPRESQSHHRNRSAIGPAHAHELSL